MLQSDEIIVRTSDFRILSQLCILERHQKLEEEDEAAEDEEAKEEHGRGGSGR